MSDLARDTLTWMHVGEMAREGSSAEALCEDDGLLGPADDDAALAAARAELALLQSLERALDANDPIVASLDEGQLRALLGGTLPGDQREQLRAALDGGGQPGAQADVPPPAQRALAVDGPLPPGWAAEQGLREVLHDLAPDFPQAIAQHDAFCAEGDWLLRSLADEEPTHAAQVAMSYGHHPLAAQLEPALLALFDHANWRPRRAAIDAFAHHASANPEVGERLRAILAGDPDPYIRKSAALALPSSGGDGARAALEAALEDDNNGVRNAAQRALSRLS